MKIETKMEIIRKLIEVIKYEDNGIKTFRDLVDYVIYLEGGYLEVVVEHTDFFKEYLDHHLYFLENNEIKFLK